MSQRPLSEGRSACLPTTPPVAYLCLVRSMRQAAILLLILTLSVSATQNKNYQVVKSARIFAIGGIGYAGRITDEETAFDGLCKAPDVAEQFRRLLREATIEGQMYALLGLRQVGAPDYKTQADRYRKSTRKVKTGSGCEIGPNKVSYVVNEWINKMTLK